ncbi:MAG: hypothetical protein WAV20_11200 [Blastocatellia bacterium]
MRRRKILEITVILAAAIIISYQLLFPPLIGMADNGDFGRFFRAGFEHMTADFDDRYFSYFNSKFRIVPAAFPGWYLSSTEVPIRIARLAGIVFVDRQVFDIRVLGGIYALLLLAGMGLLLVASRKLVFAARLVFGILLVLILTDPSYIASFNSFFSEPTALVFFVLAAGCALLVISGQGSMWLLLAYFVCSTIFVTSKPMHAPFAVLFALFGIYLARVAGFKNAFVLAVSLSVLLCTTAVGYYWVTPHELREKAVYIELFTDFLQHSPTREQDLVDMGLDQDWARFAGTNPYSADSPIRDPAFKTELMARVGPTTIPFFYLRRPLRFYELIQRCSRHIQQMTSLGYYEKSSGHAPFAQPFGLWYRLRAFLFPRSIWTLVGFFAAGTAATALGIVGKNHSRRRLAVFCAVLTAAALGQFLIPVLMFGENDLPRYLFLFNLIFDVGLIGVLVMTVQAVFSRHSLSD